MSNYTKLVDYAAKDSLSSGTPLKVLSGTEINNDLAEIATAISTKADTANATHTGTSAFAAITANSVVSTTLAGALTGNVTGNVTGNLTGDVTGDVTGNSDTATTAATVTTAAQPAITSVGTLTSLAVSGTVDGRDVAADGVKLDAMASFAVGDTGPAGGLVFWVDHTGMHGLEAAPSDQSSALAWYNSINGITTAIGSGIGAGFVNSLVILSQPLGTPPADRDESAAGICADFVLNGFADWFLPSEYELKLMYTTLHLNSLGGFTGVDYWSSTEMVTNGSNGARVVDFSDGTGGNMSKFHPDRVRGCRHF